MTESFEDLQTLVIQWSKDRQIIPHSTPIAQHAKAEEEMRELKAALRFWEAAKRGDDIAEGMTLTIDALGDVMVCLINIATLCRLDLVGCLAAAYDQIKDRKGYLREDGIFVKDES